MNSLQSGFHVYNRLKQNMHLMQLSLKFSGEYFTDKDKNTKEPLKNQQSEVWASIF